MWPPPNCFWSCFFTWKPTNKSENPEKWLVNAVLPTNMKSPNGESHSDMSPYCWCFRNPGKLTSWGTGSLSHFLDGFYTSKRWLFRISEPSTVCHLSVMTSKPPPVSMSAWPSPRRVAPVAWSWDARDFLRHFIGKLMGQPFYTNGWLTQLDDDDDDDEEQNLYILIGNACKSSISIHFKYCWLFPVPGFDKSTCPGRVATALFLIHVHCTNDCGSSLTRMETSKKKVPLFHAGGKPP